MSFISYSEMDSSSVYCGQTLRQLHQSACEHFQTFRNEFITWQAHKKEDNRHFNDFACTCCQIWYWK